MAASLLSLKESQFPEDKETLLNKADLYLTLRQFNKAKTTYETLKKQHQIIGLNGLALIENKKNKNKKALKISNSALKLLDEKTDNKLIIKTIERNIQALIWNKKFENAEIEINKQFEKYGNENWILALRATLNTYKSNFDLCIEDKSLNDKMIRLKDIET